MVVTVIICCSQVHGGAGMPDIQCIVYNRSIFKLRQRNVILDGKLLLLHTFVVMYFRTKFVTNFTDCFMWELCQQYVVSKLFDTKS